MTITIVGKGDELIAVEYLAAMQELAFERGIEPHKMLQDTGLPMDVFIQEGVKVGAESIARMMLNCPELVDDPMLPYDYARRLTLSRHGILGFAINSCSNLGEAITLLTQYMGIRAQSYRLIPDLTRDPVRVVMENTNHDAGSDENMQLINELFTVSVLCCLAFMAKQFIGQLHNDRSIRVHTIYPHRGIEPARLLPLVDVIYSADFNGLECPANLLSSKPALHNSAISMTALAKCDAELNAINELEGNLKSRVRELLIDTDSGEWRTVEQVASLVFMSPTSLKRKLAALDTSFQRIKNSERFNRAIALLMEDRLTLETIALQLGYNNASNFGKAFKGWTGCSPKDYRNMRKS